MLVMISLLCKSPEDRLSRLTGHCQTITELILSCSPSGSSSFVIQSCCATIYKKIDVFAFTWAKDQYVTVTIWWKIHVFWHVYPDSIPPNINNWFRYCPSNQYSRSCSVLRSQVVSRSRKERKAFAYHMVALFFLLFFLSSLFPISTS